MLSTMQDVPLQIRRLLEHGTARHASATVDTATPGGLRRVSYAEIGVNAARLAHALRELGVGEGDRVATFMWNNAEHVEAYFAVPCMGAVLHPLNIRLSGDQIAFIADHAEDRVIIVDGTLLPLLAPLLPRLKTVEHLIVNRAGGADPGAFTAPKGVTVHDYAELLAGCPAGYDWPEVDERQAAAMCYTSGTTGDPKGVVYSHRSIYLHAMAAAMPDAFDLSAHDKVLGIVPQFHVLAWGLPYAAFLTGASLAMPDRFLSPGPLAAFIRASRPGKGAGVPTVWQGLLAHVEGDPDADISSLREAVVGGSACPPALMDAYDRHGITLLHAWGMTEMSPLGTVARPPVTATGEEVRAHRLTQGRFPAPVEARLVGPDGVVLPHDGESVGELEVRGPWITGSYYRAEDPDRFHDGWLRTGDVGHISPDGYLTLTDRAKDVIKSGGEWISSVELENHLMGHPAVAEAAVVGVPDDKWGERPLATVVIRDGHQVTFDELRDFLATRVARWQVPERWAIVTEVPKTSVGKFSKATIRACHAAGEYDVVYLR
ncbi:fatty-acyl-CoA synthase [Thermomonospora echinospora]|uniref:Fatty-acyl-CoA synthase n=1 Tax=Thermomonospora echinospora TaxID=1992 RepID=A0A1H6DWS6_9ACTN|nr:long-chain fatty acid--CoA ligase [Thermomonospora echinospora]SEG89721.1 fatty-acyl-CoA synthase [Thermomonospora echinospora]